jgi:uncharacterized membrane protein
LTTACLRLRGVAVFAMAGVHVHRKADQRGSDGYQ